jgi:hypothetical protein
MSPDRAASAEQAGNAASPAADPQAGPPGGAGGVVVRRTLDGWRVEGSAGGGSAPPGHGQEDDAVLPDLVSAMVLAELLADDVPRPRKPAFAEAGTTRLKATIVQLEHALAARVRIEQAIGVLAERHRLSPRQAFGLLRKVARSGGRRVHDVAGDVVASATNPLLLLPSELARTPVPPPARRRSHRRREE